MYQQISNTMLANLMAGKRQTANIVYWSTPVGEEWEEDIYITEADIMQGGLKIDRQCPLGIGNAVAAEMELVLYNPDGHLDGLARESGTYTVRIGTKDWDDPSAQIEEIPMGVFLTDAVPTFSGNTIRIKALDRMILFDKVVADWADWGIYSFPMNIKNFVNIICSFAGIQMSSAGFVDCTSDRYNVNWNSEFQKVSLRTILRWCCFILGVNAQMDPNGTLLLSSIGTGYDEYLYSNKVYVNQLGRTVNTVTGFEYTNNDGTVVLYGSLGYVLNFQNCPILDNNLVSVLQNIESRVSGWHVCDGTVETYSMPHLWPMDTAYIHFDSWLPFIVTNTTYKMNGHSRTAFAANNPRVQNSSRATGSNNGVTTLTESDVIYVKQLIANAIAANNL